MSEIVKMFLGFIIGFPLITWIVASGSGWQELAEKYQTTRPLPNTFYVAKNQRIIFKPENKNGSAALTQLGIGVLEDRLYLSTKTIPYLSDIFFPALLIPWTDIAYRKITNANSSSEYFTFYLGNPQITRFSINVGAIAKLEEDYGEPIFLNKLGEPD